MLHALFMQHAKDLGTSNMMGTHDNLSCCFRDQSLSKKLMDSIAL